MKTVGKILVFAFAFALLPGTSNSQSFELPKSADLLSVTMIPSIPAPFDHVTIDLKSFMTNLDTATISWSAGNLKKTGRGEKHFEFDVGDVGSITTVNITIQTMEGTTVTRSLSIRPGNIDLLFEAETYTPPLYKGKALYTPGANVKVMAMPNMVDERGVRLESKDLIYGWKINGKLQENASGFGKNVLYTTNPSVLRALTVEVEVSSLSGNTKAKENITLNEANPLILFYEDNPLLGTLYERALPSQITLGGKEVTLMAVPYFFGTEEKDSGITYSWSLNDKALTEKQSTITLRTDTEEGGTASLEVEIKSISNMFQFARNLLLVSFGTSVR